MNPHEEDDDDEFMAMVNDCSQTLKNADDEPKVEEDK